MKEIIDGHVCEMIINDDGSFTFKFDEEETWHTRTAAKKMAEIDNTFDKIFKVYFKGVIERYTFSKRIERYKLKDSEVKLYYTVQPRKVLDNLQKTGFYELTDPHNYMNVLANKFRDEAKTSLGYYPIYCRPYVDALHLWFDLLWLSPQYPDDILFFKSNNIENIAYKEMRRIWNGGTEINATITDELYECVTPDITHDSVICVLSIGEKGAEDADQACVNMANALFPGLLYLHTCDEFNEKPIIPRELNLLEASQVHGFFDKKTLDNFIDYNFTLKEYKRAFYHFKCMLYDMFDE